MDTPERIRFGGTPISKFEDSPVFNFINNLSPIQPVKSVHSIHTFHSPGSATIASVFSSPHVSLHKESRFFIRNPFPDSVKPGTSSDLLDENDIPPVSDDAVLSTSSVLAQESSNMTCHLNRAAVDPADENSTQPNYSEPFKFDNGSPDHNTTPLYSNKLDFKLHISCTPSEHVQLVQDVSEGAHKTLSPDFGLEMEFSADQVKEDASESNWKNLISDNDDGLLRVEPTSGLGTVKTKEQENEFSMSARPKASFDMYVHNDSRDSLVVDDGTSELHTLNLLPDTCQEQEILEEGYLNTEAEIDDGSSLGCKLNSQQHRGVRRRCLVFEVAAVSKKNLHNDSNAAPTIISPTNAKSISVNEQLLSPKNLKSPKSYVLPGIGLHLNALARTSKDSPIPQKTKVPGRDFVCRPCSVRPYVPLIPGEKQPEKALERKDASGSEVSDNQIVSFDATLTPTMGIEESASPKKKRRKVENSGENDNCRRCNCKKSKCLKLYCECFAAGVYCVEPCSCQGCLNKPVHEETVLATRKQIESRNPLAFAPKVIRTSEHDQEIGEESNKTPASARHKRGCNCKKSNCLKKYCECYQGGVGCSFSCRCEGCKNAFGRKEGSEEIEYEEELDTCEKESIKPDNDKAIAIVPKTDQIQLSESPLPITPFGACSAVKTASPNGKRVSLPLNGFGMSPNFKGGRKLILKSIPSFPSLSCETHSSAQLNSSTSA